MMGVKERTKKEEGGEGERAASKSLEPPSGREAYLFRSPSSQLSHWSIFLLGGGQDWIELEAVGSMYITDPWTSIILPEGAPLIGEEELHLASHPCRGPPLPLSSLWVGCTT